MLENVQPGFITTDYDKLQIYIPSGHNKPDKMQQGATPIRVLQQLFSNMQFWKDQHSWEVVKFSCDPNFIQGQNWLESTIFLGHFQLM